MHHARLASLVRWVFLATLAVAAGCGASSQPGLSGSGGQGSGTGGQPGGSGGTGGSGYQTPDAGPPSPSGSGGGDAPADALSAPPDVAPADGPGATPDTGGGTPNGVKPPAMPSAGCGAAGQLAEGAGTLPGGRRYIVRLPTGYEAGKPFPLVFALHYNGGNIGEFDNAGTRAAFHDWAILVLTQSQTGDWRQAFAADLAYFDMLVALMKDKLCVDTGRIYSFGFSGGASFSNLLACQRTFLRAVGGGGGIPGYNGYTAADCKPTPAWIDEGARAGLLEMWTAKDGCMQSMPGVRANCRNYVCSIAPVIYCTNGAHAWPSYGNSDVSAFFKQF